MEKVNGLIYWSSSKDAVFTSLNELNKVLDDLQKQFNGETPVLVNIFTHRSFIYSAVGSDESFVEISGENGIAPCWIVEGDLTADGLMAYKNDKGSISELRRRYVIPTTEAREIINEFVKTKHRSNAYTWEQA